MPDEGNTTLCRGVPRPPSNQAYTMSFRAKSRNPRGRNGTPRTRASPLAGRGSLPSVAGATVSASARFSRYGCAYAQNDKLLGRTRRFIWINIINPSVHPYRFVIASEAWQSRGNEMLATYPRVLPRRIRRHFDRSDSAAEKSPAEETQRNVRLESLPPWGKVAQSAG